MVYESLPLGWPFGVLSRLRDCGSYLEDSIEAASLCRSLAPIEPCNGELPLSSRVGKVDLGLGCKGGESILAET